MRAAAHRAAGRQAVPVQPTTGLRRSAGPAGLLALQRSAGNRAVQRYVGGAGLQTPRFAGDADLEAARAGTPFVRRKGSGPGVSTGEGVRKLQQALIDLGHPLPTFGVDGDFGAETAGAMRSYQLHRGLGSDAVVGPKTMGRLDDDFASERATPAAPSVEPAGATPSTTGPTTTPTGPGTTPGGGPAGPGTTSPTEVFATPLVQEIHDENSGTLRPDQVAGLHQIDGDASGPWSKLQWRNVQVGAAMRVVNPLKVDQGTLNLCGPATALQYLADVDPVEYAALVEDIFQTGAVKGTKVNPRLLANEPVAGMSNVDWMSLSAYRDAKNLIRDFDGTESEEDNGVPALTSQYEMARWMEDDLGCVETDSMDCSIFGGAMGNARRADELLRRHGRDVVVALQVNKKALDGKTSAGSGLWGFVTGAWPGNHWMRLLPPGISFGSEVDFEAFTWASSRHFGPYRRKHFASEVLWWIVVGARKPGLL